MPENRYNGRRGEKNGAESFARAQIMDALYQPALHQRVYVRRRLRDRDVYEAPVRGQAGLAGRAGNAGYDGARAICAGADRAECGNSGRLARRRSRGHGDRDDRDDFAADDHSYGDFHLLFGVCQQRIRRPRAQGNAGGRCGGHRGRGVRSGRQGAQNEIVDPYCPDARSIYRDILFEYQRDLRDSRIGADRRDSFADRPAEGGKKCD